MIIGVDFDNTIVCYDALFKKSRLNAGWWGRRSPAYKRSVRDHVRQTSRDQVWTELQGVVYGQRMHEAEPFDGAVDFFKRCRGQGISVYIVSHRTPTPQVGEPFDLYQAARHWLASRGFHDPGGIALLPDDVFLEPTQDEKVARIAALGCTHFIDDLQEFIERHDFPESVRRILFDPGNLHANVIGIERVDSWKEVDRLIFGDEISADQFGPLLAAAGLEGPPHLTRLGWWWE